MVTPYFGGSTETLIILSKKNGKSTLIAALVIFHILTTPDADCVVVAVSREQAEIILRQAAGFIRRHPGLQGKLRVLRREIISLDDGGRARVLAADEDTAEGVIPTLAIVDEVHGAKSVALYDSLRLGIGPRHGRMVAITIAGSTLASPLGQKRMKGREMPGFHRDHEKRFGSVITPQFAFLEWCLDPEDDPNDLKLVKLVNPAPWKTLESLAEEQAAVSPYSWLRLACGVWTEGTEPWLDPAKWDALASNVELADDEMTWLGVGVGIRAETAALALIQKADEQVRVKVQILEKTGLEEIEEAIRRVPFPLAMMVYGSRMFQRSADLLEAEGIPVLQYPLTPQRMVEASGTLNRLVEEGRLRHDGDPAFREQVLAGRTKQTEAGWRFVNDPAIPVPIDALIALTLAAHEATATQEVGLPMFGWG